MSPLLSASRLSRAEALAREIEDEISAGVLGTGDRLGTKDDLRQRFNVAVATVNEAVKLLDTRGLVEARPGPGGGVFVAGPASRMRGGPIILGHEWAGASMADYDEVRDALEPLIFRHAARRAGEADLRELRSIVAEMAGCRGDAHAFMRHNAAFHRRAASLTPNAPLRSLYLTLLDFYESALAARPPQAVHPGSAGAHRALVDAFESGDEQALREAISRHGAQRQRLER